MKISENGKKSNIHEKKIVVVPEKSMKKKIVVVPEKSKCF